jgi:hypothetical protein
MREPERSPSARHIPSGSRIALNFLPFREQDFEFTVYRRRLGPTDQAVSGTRWLPIDCLGELSVGTPRFQYAVSLTKADGYEETDIRAWVSPKLTVHVLHQALVTRARANDLMDNCEFPLTP